MRVNGARAFGIFAAIVLFCGTPQAQPANPPISDKELVVATKESPPFMMKHPDGTLHGISISLWRRIADRLHLRYRFSEQPTVQILMAGTAEGSFDAAIAALTVTAARDRVVDFTQPFYSTGLGIAVSIGESRWMSVSRALLSFGFFQAVLVLVGIAILVGFVIWLLERDRTEHFKGGAKGLGTGVVVRHRDDSGGCSSECAGDAAGAHCGRLLDDCFHYSDCGLYCGHHLDTDQAGTPRGGERRK